jgi:hypothetical protein
MVAQVKELTGWQKIDRVELNGNYSKGRECTAISNDKTFKYYFKTYGDGTMMKFEER